MSGKVRCPTCGVAILEGDKDYASRRYFCRNCQDTWPMPAPRSKPPPAMAQAADPTAGSSGDAVIPRPPRVPYATRENARARSVAASLSTGVGASPLGGMWRETWDGVAWNIVLRRFGLLVVLAFLSLVVAAGFWVYGQRELFGYNVTIGAGVGLLFALIVFLWMSRWTYIRLDSRHLRIEHRPNGRASTIAVPKVERFVVLDAGRGQAVHNVHFLSKDGVTLRLDLDLHTEAEARFVGERLNDMLDNVRGLKAEPSS
jgi:hypothetical protein